MRTYNITNRISTQARREIERIIKTHERYRKAYFFHPNESSSGRRRNEKRFKEVNPDVSFQRGTEVISVSMEYSESCRNVYYTLYINSSTEGKKNIGYIKKLLK